MNESPEQNRNVKAGLDILLDGVGQEAFLKPMTSDEDAMARGLLDETGNATSKGVLYSELLNVGALNADGTLTGRSAAWLMPLEQAHAPENMDAFKVRWRDGIDDADTSFSEMASGLGTQLWDAGAGLLKRGWEEIKIGTPWEDKNKLVLSGTALVEGSVKANKELLGMLAIGSDLLSEQFAPLVGAEEAAEDQLWISRQNLARTRHQHQTAAVGKVLEDTGMFANAVEYAAAAKSALPASEAAAITKQSGAAGSFATADMLLPIGAAEMAGKAGLITRAGIKADSVLAKTAMMDARLAETGVHLAATQQAAVTAKNASVLASKLADDAAVRFEATGEQILAQRAARAGEIAERTAKESAEHAAAASRLTEEAEQLATLRNSYATRIPETVAAATQQAIEIGRKAKSVPLTAIGGAGEKVGKFLIDSNTALAAHAKAHGYEAALNVMKYGLAPVAGLSIGGIPGAAATFGVLASGPIIEASSKFARIVGQELSKARGQIPFWQRVANYSELSAPHRFMSHMLDTATLGGAVPGVVRRTARGATAAYPINLMFEYLNDGGDPNSDMFKRAAASSLVIGGSTAMLGGMFQGTRARHKELALGDELNFRQDMTDPRQRAEFNGMKPEIRRSIATFAASNPQLEIRFTNTGGGSYADGVATINPRSINPLKPLIAHEVMHHVVIRNQNEAGVIALMLGDGETGGVLRSHDGSLDPGFQKFHEAYNARMLAEGRQPIDISKAALEYYVDAAADHVSSIAESGELGAISGRSQARRLISKIVEATFPKIPIIRDIHFKTGGLLDADGRMVMGSGLLADGIRESPQARAMTRQMLRNSSGRSQGQFKPIGQGHGPEGEGGAKLAITKEDKPLLEKIGVSVFEREKGPDGRQRNKIGKDGNPVLLTRENDKARSEVGATVEKALKDRPAVPGDESQIHIDASGEIKGNHFPGDVMKAIEDKGIYNPDQLRNMRNINDAIRPVGKFDPLGNPVFDAAGKPIKEFMGHRFTVLYHAALKTIGKRKKYESLAPTIRDVVPVSWIIAKNGPISYGLLDVGKLHANIEARLASKRGQTLYKGNREQLFNDVKNVMELHRADRKTDAYFEESYGAARGGEYKNFVNTLFGVMTPAMKDVNPLFQADKIGYESNVYRTFRLDRTSSAVKMTADTHVPMPFVYDSAKLNLMPNGLPSQANYLPDGLPVSAINAGADQRGQH